MNINIHIALLLVIMGITLVYSNGEQTITEKKRCLIATTLIMTFFSGLRTWWFGDLIKYYTLYTKCNGDNWKDTVFENKSNIGIRLFFHYAGRVGISYDICIFIIAALSAVCMGVLIYRYSSSPYWSYLVFIAMGFYLFTYSGLKQTIAMAFLMLAMMAVLEDNFLVFVIWVLVASVFHAPAFIFILAYPIAKKKIDGYYYFIIIVTIILIFLYRDNIVEFLGEAYYETENLYYGDLSFGGRLIMMVFIMIIGVGMRPLRTSDSLYCPVFNMIVFAACIQVFSMYNNNFTRLADYYYQFIILFLPMFMESGDHQAEVSPERIYEIRYFSRGSIMLAGTVITMFSLWYYFRYIHGTEWLLKNFKFFWQIDPYALYGN